jgi:N-acetylglutamate synthase-like GNAT family acetyltransferase
MHVREAREEDAEAACLAIRRSIVELCRADHRGDGPTLAAWLANKTPHNVRTWIANPDSHMFVAEENGAILGAASIQSSGRIALNYVSPDARFRGVSKALMARMEAKASELGLEACTLESTGTARQFYLAIGYSENEPRRAGFGVTLCYPMAKRLMPHR